MVLAWHTAVAAVHPVGLCMRVPPLLALVTTVHAVDARRGWAPFAGVVRVFVAVRLPKLTDLPEADGPVGAWEEGMGGMGRAQRTCKKRWRWTRGYVLLSAHRCIWQAAVTAGCVSEVPDGWGHRQSDAG